MLLQYRDLLIVVVFRIKESHDAILIQIKQVTCHFIMMFLLMTYELRKYYVYFMTNKNNNVLYIGITGNLVRRVYQHKVKLFRGFTAKYSCDKLVY